MAFRIDRTYSIKELAQATDYSYWRIQQLLVGGELRGYKDARGHWHISGMHWAVWCDEHKLGSERRRNE